jgi:hypothetical protein
VPFGKQLVDGLGVGVARPSRISRSDNNWAISERISRCCWVACSGTKQEDQQRYRLAVGRFERNGLGQPHEGGQRLLQALDAAVRNGHAGAETGGTERFAREQVVGHGGPGHAMVVLEQEPGLLEDPLLAGDGDVEVDVAGWQQFGQTIHGRCTRSQSGEPTRMNRPAELGKQDIERKRRPHWSVRPL